MLNKFNRMENNKKIPIVIGISIILIVFIIVFSSYKPTSFNYNSLKEDSSKAFVYTVNHQENDLYRIEVPYVNIGNSFGKSINEDIDSYVYDFYDKEKVILSYDYNINGKVLSLVIKAVNYDVKNVPEVYFKTYNINLEDVVLLGDEDLLAIYDMNSEKVEITIENKFEYWYKEVQKEGYINEEECDYECFLKYRGVNDYLDDVVYYIDKGKLVAFKPFIFYSVFGEENYFKEKDFRFILSE